MVGLISGWPERLFRAFQYSHSWSGSPTKLIRIHRPPLTFFLFLFCIVLMVMQRQVIYNCFVEVSADDMLLQVYIIMYKYLHRYKHTYYINTTEHTHRYIYIFPLIILKHFLLVIPWTSLLHVRSIIRSQSKMSRILTIWISKQFSCFWKSDY